MDNEVLLGAYVFLLAIFLGFELIGRVPSLLHTPLMSGTNAIHGIVLLGAMLILGDVHSFPLKVLGFVAVVLGAANVFGGFVVTDRMLQMFGGRARASQDGQTGGATQKRRFTILGSNGRGNRQAAAGSSAEQNVARAGQAEGVGQPR